MAVFVSLFSDERSCFVEISVCPSDVYERDVWEKQSSHIWKATYLKIQPRFKTHEGLVCLKWQKMTWRFTTTLLVAEAPRLKSPEISFSLPLSLDSEAWWDFSREVGGGVFINNLSSLPPLWNLPPSQSSSWGKTFFLPVFSAMNKWRRRQPEDGGGGPGMFFNFTAEDELIWNNNNNKR